MKGPVLLLLCTALLAGCGGDDEDDEPPEPAAGTATFRSDEIAFTFDYPRDLTVRRRPRQRVLAQISVERGGQLNAIKVRLTSESELEPERYLAEFQRDFEGNVETVDTREERIGDLDVGILELVDGIERGGEEVEVTSSSYFFTGGGRTWQVECVAEEEHLAQIEAACETVLGSVEFEDAE